MEFNVVNHEICVGNIKVVGVSSASIFLVGDVQTVQLASAFDTPPSSFILHPTTAPTSTVALLHHSIERIFKCFKEYLK